MILLDTNILLRLSHPNDPLRSVTQAAIESLQNNQQSLCIVPQNLYEFWSAATRPVAANGLGFDIVRCQETVKDFKSFFRLIDDPPLLFDEWESLVIQHQCHGRVSFDARLVAAMRLHGLSEILTYNVSDFARYPGLMVIDPKSVVSQV